jgi:hypothetical protein
MIDCNKEQQELQKLLKSESSKKKPDPDKIKHIQHRIAVIDRLEAFRNLKVEDYYNWMLELSVSDKAGDSTWQIPLKANSRTSAVKESEKILKKETGVKVARLYRVELEKEFKVT